MDMPHTLHALTALRRVNVATKDNALMVEHVANCLLKPLSTCDAADPSVLPRMQVPTLMVLGTPESSPSLTSTARSLVQRTGATFKRP